MFVVETFGASRPLIIKLPVVVSPHIVPEKLQAPTQGVRVELVKGVYVPIMLNITTAAFACVRPKANTQAASKYLSGITRLLLH